MILELDVKQKVRCQLDFNKMMIFKKVYALLKIVMMDTVKQIFVGATCMTMVDLMITVRFKLNPKISCFI